MHRSRLGRMIRLFAAVTIVPALWVAAPASAAGSCSGAACVWDFTGDAIANVNATTPVNPWSDSYGHTSAWTFTDGTSVAATFTSTDSLPQWTTPSGYPHLIVNNTATDVTCSCNGTTFPANATTIHPSPTSPGVVKWTDPIPGTITVNVRGAVTDEGLGGGDGIGWQVLHNSGALASGSYGDGGSQRFNEGAGGSTLNAISVSYGDTLSLRINPDRTNTGTGDYNYDTTKVAFTITEGASVAASATTVAINSQQFPSPIGVDYYEPTNTMLLSVNFNGGQPNNFDTVDAAGNFAQFSQVAGLGDEVYMAAIRTSSCEGGFTPGDVYFGTGTAGEIGRLTSGGTVYQSWVKLPGETGMLRGGLFQDVYCSFGGDLIVTTTAGDVWRVTSAGLPTLVQSGVGDTLEGPTTVPVDPRYGPLSGTILVASEGAGTIESVDAQGTVKTYTGFPWAEAVHIVPPHQNFFGVDWQSNTLRGVPAAQFTGVVGDIVVATELPGALLDVTWNSTSNSLNPPVDLLSQDAVQWEGTTFAPAGLPGVSAIANTSVTYTGDTSGQYSDPVKVSAHVQNIQGQPLGTATVNFTLGNQTASAVTNSSGDASTTMTLNQLSGPTTVKAEFAATGSDPGGTSGQQVFTINKEDCTLTGQSTILSNAASPTALPAQFGELDVTHGSWTGKSISFSGVDSSSNHVGPFTANTNATGLATAAAPLGPGVYSILSNFTGDSYYNGCGQDPNSPTIVTVSPAAFKVTGGGWFSNTTGRTSFGFNALSDVTGLHGQIQVHTPKGNFHGSTVTSLSTATNTGTWSGTGVWNGKSGYTYQVSVYDGGTSKNPDTVSIVIKYGNTPTPTWSTGGAQPLKGGNILVHS